MADGSKAGTGDEAYVTTTDDANLQWFKLPAMTSLYDESGDFKGEVRLIPTIGLEQRRTIV